MKVLASLGPVALAERVHRHAEAALEESHQVCLALKPAVGGDGRDRLARGAQATADGLQAHGADHGI